MILRKINHSISNIWKGIGNAGITFLNILPKLGITVAKFFGDLFTDVFNSIYNQQIDQKSARNVIVGFFVVAGLTTLIFAGVCYKIYDFFEKKIETKKPEKNKNKSIKKPEVKVKKETKTPDPKVKKEAKKPELKVKRNNVAEVILPDLNLKTETVIQLFKDVDYDLKTVRNEKLVKPIYFTQFPRDLDNLQSVQLKKETFIKIVLPLIVAENEKILDDRLKLQTLIDKKFTTDSEKQWLRQKLLEYKVKKGDLEELLLKMDVIPASIALAQAAKESGWGTSRFALEGNAIFGQWTWDGQGIAPLKRDGDKNHKILRFPILRASVKAYKNNLNTHKAIQNLEKKENS